MFTMAKVKDDNTTGNNFMFNHLSCNDYYAENEKVVGYWHGKLAECFGVSGNEIAAAEFVSIQKNENPWTGGKLTPAVRKGSSRFFDFQCSAQKSVSIMAVVMNDQRLSAAHSECVKEALTEMEKFVSCRIRKGTFRNSEKLEVTGNLIAGLYNHNASRALDPQIHTHCVVANVTWCESEQRYKALSEFEILKAIRYCGKFYQSAMAKRVQELGYEIELKRTDKGIEGFEIKGVDNELLKRYSRRRTEIEQRIEEFFDETGRKPTAAEVHVIAKQTREAKLTEITTPEVLKSQRKMLSETELSHLRSIKYSALENEHIIKRIGTWEMIKIFSKTVDHLYERKSVVVGHELLAEALNQGMKNARIEDLKYALKVNKKLIPLTQSTDLLNTYYITKEALDMEREAIQLANAGIGIFNPLGDINDIYTSDLSSVQKNAVQGILECQDFACLLRGHAGAGKTTVIKPIHEGLIASGRNPLYLAPTRGAVKVLKRDGFENATTVASFLYKPEIPPNTVLIVDESSLLSAKIGHKLMCLAKENNARIIFVGDRRQHLSVEAGDFLKVLEFYSNIKNFELSQIVRQIPKHYRKAVQLMANNRAAEGLERLNDLGVVHERSHHYLSMAARSYVYKINDGKECLLVSPTHREIDTLNTLVRKELSEQGTLDFSKQRSRTCFQDLNWTRNQIANYQNYRPGNAIRFNTALFGTPYKKHDILVINSVLSNGDLLFENGDTISAKKIKITASAGLIKSLDLAPGDKILITANNKDYDLTNGDIGTIDYIFRDGDILLEDGRIIPKDFESISYGYATTSHKSQGSTCDHAILAAAQMSNRACYVGSSRGRQSVKVYTPDFEHLLSSVKRNSEHLTGHDLIAARQEYMNFAPKQEIENVPKTEEIQQETRAAREKCITDIYPKKVIESVPKKEETQQEIKMEYHKEPEIEPQQEFGMSM